MAACALVFPVFKVHTVDRKILVDRLQSQARCCEPRGLD